MKPIAALILAAALGACGGTEPAAPYMWGGTVTITTGTPGVDCVGATIVTVTYSATGVSPASVSVPVGGCVDFVNNDAVAHWPESNSHCTVPQHQQCTWLNMPLAGPPAGIQPGGHYTVGPAPATPTTCGFHDHLHPPTCGGGGY